MSQIEAIEQVVIGMAMSDADNFAYILQQLGSAEFESKAHNTIWSAARDTFNQTGRMDHLTVAALLEQRGQLASIRRDYIDDVRLTAFGKSQEDAAVFCKQVVDADARRRLKRLGLSIAESADSSDPNTLRLQAMNELGGLLRGSYNKNDFRGIGEIVSEREATIQSRVETPIKTIGIQTGFTVLDYKLNGLKSALHIVAGRPSMGKTAYALSLLASLARRGVRGGFISIEMNEDELTYRLLAILSSLPSKAFEVGWFTDTDDGRFAGAPGKPVLVRDYPNILKKMREAVEELRDLPIHINTHPAPTTTDARLSLMRLIAQVGAEVAMLDHLHLMSYDDMQRGAQTNLVAAFTFISRNLKQIPKELGIPLIALAQLSRSNTARVDKRPELQDLRESGSIEQDAATVGFVHREAYYHKNDKKWLRENAETVNLAELIIAKNQLGGETGAVEFFYDAPVGAFRELSRE